MRYQKISDYTLRVFTVFYCCTSQLFLCGLPIEETVRIDSTNECPRQLDVAFAIDASYSVAPYYHQLLQLVKEFSSRVNVSKDAFRVSVTQFSSDATVELYLSNGTSLHEIYRNMNLIKYHAGNTETGLALLTIREQVFNLQHGDRGNVPDLIILITDGPASNHESFMSESHKLRESGVLVFAVSLGFLTDLQELHEIAGNNVIVSSEELVGVANLSESIISKICEVFGPGSLTTTDPTPFPAQTNSIDQLQTMSNSSNITDTTPSLASKTTMSSNNSIFRLDMSNTPVKPKPTNSSSSSRRTFSNDTIECHMTNDVDVVYLIDSSKNVGSSQFSHVKSLLMTFLVKFMGAYTGLHRVGIIQYSDDAVKVLPLDYVNSSRLQDAVRTLSYTGGNSNLAAALNVFESDVLTTQRSGVARIGVVISGGLSTQRNLTRLHASILHHNHVDVFVIGVGDHIAQDELSVLASEPRADHVFMVRNLSADNDSFSNALSSLCFGILAITRNSMNTTPVQQHLTASPSSKPKPVNTTLDPTVAICRDKLDNCTSLTREDCQKDKTWTLTFCAESCGHCLANNTPFQDNRSDCTDSIPNCSDYGEYICRDPSYKDWTEKHCFKYCRMCDGSLKDTAAGDSSNPSSNYNNSTSDDDSTMCKDILPDCQNYGGPSVCLNFRAWSSVRCRRYCGFCSATKPTQPAKGLDLRCPRWMVPAECSMQTVEWSQCPMLSCPDGYVLTAVPQG